MPVFVHFAPEAWILQAFSQPSSSMSHWSVIYAFSPTVSAKGRVRLYKPCGGGNTHFPLVAWEEAVSRHVNSESSSSWSRASLPRHSPFSADYWMSLLFLRLWDGTSGSEKAPREHLAPLASSSLSEEEGSQGLLWPTRPASRLPGINRLDPFVWMSVLSRVFAVFLVPVGSFFHRCPSLGWHSFPLTFVYSFSLEKGRNQMYFLLCSKWLTLGLWSHSITSRREGEMDTGLGG